MVIESQWNRAKHMLNLPTVAKLRRVKLQSYRTTFWRWQTTGDEGLATVEGRTLLLEKKEASIARKT